MKTRKPNVSFTLIELIIVIAIITILAVIAVVNFTVAIKRTNKSADAANMRTVGSALQIYFSDYNTLPPADREAGPFQSSGYNSTGHGNGPAAGGSWDGLPWVLYDLGYITDYKFMFNPTYLKQYRFGTTIRGGHPRYHNFRYAYNSSALSSGGHLGGDGNIMTGVAWIIRDLYLDAKNGFYASRYPRPPADYKFPWGDGKYENKLEHVMFSDMSVKTVIGGSDEVFNF